MSPSCRWGKRSLLSLGDKQMREGRGYSQRCFLLPSPTFPLPLDSFSPPPHPVPPPTFPSLCHTPDKVGPEIWWENGLDGVGWDQVWGVLASP